MELVLVMPFCLHRLRHLPGLGHGLRPGHLQFMLALTIHLGLGIDPVL
jgi:hypothetical protein